METIPNRVLKLDSSPLISILARLFNYSSFSGYKNAHQCWRAYLFCKTKCHTQALRFPDIGAMQAARFDGVWSSIYEGRTQSPKNGSRHKQRYGNKERPDERHRGSPDQRGEAGGRRQCQTPDDLDWLGPPAPPEACQHDQQAQQPALELQSSLNFLANRARTRVLAKPSRECLPGEPDEEQYGASQKTTPNDRPMTQCILLTPWTRS